jgi:hypothetical protein
MRRRELLIATAIALLLAYHLTAVTLRALPSPEPALDRSAWNDPSVRRELDAWAKRLSALGIQGTGLELAERGAQLAEHYIALRNQALIPFNAYYAYCGTLQAWSMFQAPHRHPARLRIDLQRGGTWQPIFRERDPRYPWMGERLADTRFRSVLFRLGWPYFRGEYSRFADWVAVEAARDFPDAISVRVLFERAETPTPAQVKAGVRDAPVDDPPLERDLRVLR